MMEFFFMSSNEQQVKKRVQQEETSYLGNMMPEIIDIIGSNLEPRDLGALSCTFFNGNQALENNRKVNPFLHLVALGKQEEANAMLENNKEAQLLLQQRGTFTDYSGRTFTCSAYEYAYWAMDTHMRRMLESYMDEGTKAAMSERVDAIEEHGLSYQQHGELITGAKHFDFKPLKDAYQFNLDGYYGWVSNSNWAVRKAAWFAVGKAQADLPAHGIHEYCRKDRSFVVNDGPPEFKEESLPRTSVFYNYNRWRNETLFPRVYSDSEGLGVSFTLCRASRGMASGWALPGGTPDDVAPDLAAVCCLHEVRTNDLKNSRDFLKPGPSLGVLLEF
jgi:hypothetical protein